MLFTADLRAFSERLVAKVEKEEVIKQEFKTEESETPMKRTMVKTEYVLEPAIKREAEDDTDIAAEPDMASRVKRRRRAR